MPVLARVIRIMALPGSWNSDHVCLRFEVNGCDTTIQGIYSRLYNGIVASNFILKWLC